MLKREFKERGKREKKRSEGKKRCDVKKKRRGVDKRRLKENNWSWSVNVNVSERWKGSVNVSASWRLKEEKLRSGNAETPKKLAKRKRPNAERTRSAKMLNV